MITLVLCDRTANGTKIPGKRTAYRCPTGKDAAIVLENVTLCGARSKTELEEMQNLLYDPTIGGRTLLENPTMMTVGKDGTPKRKVLGLHEEFAR